MIRPLSFKSKRGQSHLSFGLRSEEIQRNLAQDDEIFFEGNKKSVLFEKKRVSDTDKVPEDQGDELKTQINSLQNRQTNRLGTE
jgi:hypothetical protein